MASKCAFRRRHRRPAQQPLPPATCSAPPRRRKRARPSLQPDELGRLFTWLEGRRQTLAGARNHALLLTFLETGTQPEVMRMQWGHLRPSRSQRDRVVYAWVGKGGKHDDEPLPAIVWQAITDYLAHSTVAGSPGNHSTSSPCVDDYIFRPVHTAGVGICAA